ncbi:hypothetical protein ACFQKF_14045 [Halalkalicoccus sp. GCM10025322]|uniref:hypothetical protein n=2 Tax=Halococcaceae TaxID=1963270 RepID=UPI002F969193
MDSPMPYEAAITADPSMTLLVLAVLAVVVLLGRFLLNLAWRLLTLTAVGIAVFYVGTVVLPTVLGTA